MARRGRMAAGFWMIQRQRDGGVVNPDNPHNLPEIIVGEGRLFLWSGPDKHLRSDHPVIWTDIPTLKGAKPIVQLY